MRGSDVLGTVDVMPGGAAANVAVWARRLGAEVTLVGKIGDDTLGMLMRTHLQAEGVARDVITVAGGLSTRVGILVSADGEHSFVIDHTKVLRFEAGDAPPSLLDESRRGVLQRLRHLPRQVHDVSFRPPRGGAPPPDPGRVRSVVVCADRGVRSGKAPGGRRAGRRADRQRRGGGALREGRPFTALEAHAKLVVVKQGSGGASAYAGAAAWHASANPVTVVDTTGAGDAFDAAFMAEWLASRDVVAALRAGNRLGAHVAGHLGAQPPAPADPGGATWREMPS